MGKNKFSQKEYDEIAKLLDKKCEGNRFQQKQVRHILRTKYEFNISDFNEQGKAFDSKSLRDAVKRGAIHIY